ncbi:MAG TPA: PPC domain-containing protein [Longimicrobiales bacterium]|nr:PPC domain-containing protein [Longimicrobiales bacterium]
MTFKDLLKAAAAAPLCAAALCLPSQSAAQQLPVIVPGEAAAGRLGPDDPTANGRGRFRAYQFDAVAGGYYLVTLRSSDFDAFLTIARTVGGLTDAIAMDDDGGGGTDSRLRFRAPATGRYLAIAQSLAGDGLGAYTLLLEPAQPPVEARPTPLRPGQSVTGRFVDTSPEHEEGWRYDLYTFTSPPGSRHVVTMRSADFDAYLSAERRTSAGLEHAGSNDDGAGGTDARLALSTPGEYRIYARGLGNEPAGEYTLTLAEAPPVVERAPRPARAGEAVADRLEESDAVLEDDETHYHLWTYTGSAGERLRITLRSDDFDAYLSFGRGVGAAYDELASDDDGAGGTDSLIEITLPAAGVYTIRVNTLGPGQTGAYDLVVDRLP